jgi:uncharacterized glyoxalase superfamily protein PhnB
MQNSLPVILLFGAVAACGTDTVSPTETPTSNAADEALAVDIAVGLAQACPMTAASDESARLACGEALAKFNLLRDTMEEPFLWGGQGAGKPVDLYQNHLTRFNPLVWRKMYASLFMFGSDFRIETSGTQTILRVPYAFRNALDTGSYPYPFWHSKGKWDSYQLATELVLVIEDGKLLGAMLKAGDARLGLSQDDGKKGTNRQKGVGMRIYIEANDDIDQVAARAKSSGIPLTREPHDTEWGTRAFEVTEPSGFQLTIGSRPTEA